MIYEFLTKLFGTGIAWVIYFMPCSLSYHNDLLSITTLLNQPVTVQTECLVKKNLVFNIKFSEIIILNDTISFTRSQTQSLSYDKEWKVNNIIINKERLQTTVGTVDFHYPEIRCIEGDIILVFIKAEILRDKDFSVSTGLKTQVLWNFYIPSLKQEYIFTDGKFVAR